MVVKRDLQVNAIHALKQLSIGFFLCLLSLKNFINQLYKELAVDCWQTNDDLLIIPMKSKRSQPKLITDQ